MNEVTASYVGIDICKRQLDIAVDQEGELWQSTNDEQGITATVARLKERPPALIVVESTGGLEIRLLTALYEAKLPFCRVHPGRVREFARSIGLLAKTDQLDARLIARYAEAVKPPITSLPGEDEQRLSALLSRRRQVVEMLTAEKNRLNSAPPTTLERISQHILWLQEERDKLDEEIEQFIVQTPIFRHKGGRAAIRSTLYMATLSSIQYNPVVQSFYQRLLKRGKVKKVAVVACMRKLLTILNAMIRDNNIWNTEQLNN